MNPHASLPTETLCTCGYLDPSSKIPLASQSSDLTRQIGSLLIALGNIFESVPLLRLHINSGTSQLLISIGRKLVRSSEKSTRMPC